MRNTDHQTRAPGIGILATIGALMLTAGAGHALTTSPHAPVNGWTIVLAATIGAYARAWWLAEKAAQA